MNFQQSTAKGLFRGWALLVASVIALSALYAPAATAPSQPNEEKAAAAGVSKKEWKAQKREKQREAMLKRIEQKANGVAPRKPTPQAPPHVTVSNPSQFPEDFDAK